jgi:hypothetical protein
VAKQAAVAPEAAQHHAQLPREIAKLIQRGNKTALPNSTRDAMMSMQDSTRTATAQLVHLAVNGYKPLVLTNIIKMVAS